MMTYKRIDYSIPIICLVVSAGLITYKLVEPRPSSDFVIENVIHLTGTTETDPPITSTTGKLQIHNPNLSVDRNPINQSLPEPTGKYKIVTQGSQPYLLINDKLIVLDSSQQYGTWTGVYMIQQDPLIVYYSYITSTGQSSSYLYQISKNSSRMIGDLTLLGVVQESYVFSLKQNKGRRGISAIINGELTTLYTGDYTQATYRGNTIKLDNNQPIYLQISSGS